MLSSPSVMASTQSPLPVSSSTTALAEVPESQQQSSYSTESVSLSLLIEWIVQRTYHDLTVLAELLPRKTDLERKMEIFNFVSRSHMLLIRLLSLVKWASSASKVDKCSKIVAFCDQSALTLTHTADAMAKMARETLVQATLPNFHVPAAVEVLTTGSYSRVPKCIRERILPPAPLTRVEKLDVLSSLDRLIEQRLYECMPKLPVRMRYMGVKHGMITFRVDHEFEATLTLMASDANVVPWKLVKVTILVEDREAGEGRSLLHSMQIKYVEELIQSRLLDTQGVQNQPQGGQQDGVQVNALATVTSNEPLQEVFNILHSLSQSLQLEVLFAQTQFLRYDRTLAESIRIEEYKPGFCLTLSYWRLQQHGQQAAQQGGQQQQARLSYRLSIQVDTQDSSQPLTIIHLPPLANGNKLSFNLGQLQLERLLVQTIDLRTKNRLQDLKRHILKTCQLPTEADCTIQGTPATLHIPLLQPCLRSELLIFTIDTHTGFLMVHLQQKASLECDAITKEIQQCVNSDRMPGLVGLVSKFRHWLIRERAKKTLLHLPATYTDTLAIILEKEEEERFGSLLDTSVDNKFFVKLMREPKTALFVHFQCHSNCEISFKYYVLSLLPETTAKSSLSTSNGNAKGLKNETSSSSLLPGSYFHRIDSLIELDPSSLPCNHSEKTDGSTSVKRSKGYFMSTLAQMVSLLDDQSPLTELCKAMTDHEIVHTGIDHDQHPGTSVVTVLSFAAVDQLKNLDVKRFEQLVIYSKLRVVHRNGRSWCMEMRFKEDGHNDTNKNEKSKILIFNYDFNDSLSLSSVSMNSVMQAIIKDWKQLLQIFNLYDKEPNKTALKNLTYTYKSISFEYSQSESVSVTYDGINDRYNVALSSSNGVNHHQMALVQIESELNEHKSLGALNRMLNESILLWTALAKLPTVPHMRINLERLNQSVDTFVVLPQSTSHARVIFYNTYCLDIRLRRNNFNNGVCVMIRDGAMGHFEQAKVLQDVLPLQNLKAFLSRFADTNPSVARRISQTEDDNPPSPSLVESSSSSGLAEQSLITPSLSNPMTPMSPSFLNSPSAATNKQSVNSPMSHVQSPMNVNSPFANTINTNSPRLHSTNTSTLTTTTTRVLPQRVWAGSNPTAISLSNLLLLCSPKTSLPSSLGPCLLHFFLGSQFLRRHLQHVVRQDAALQFMQTESDAINSCVTFKLESGVIFKVTTSPEDQKLRLHIEPIIDNSSMMASPAQNWSKDMMSIVETTFATRIAIPPFRPNALTAFLRLLQCPLEPLKDLIALLRFDLMTDHLPPNLRWSCKLCFVVPPAGNTILPPGSSAVYLHKNRILIFPYFTRVQPQQMATHGQEPMTVLIPIVYDLDNNQTSVVLKDPNPVVTLANQHMTRFRCGGQLNPNRCSIYPSVEDLLFNFQIPSEAAPNHQMGTMPGSLGSQPFPTSTGPPRMMGPQGNVVMMGNQMR